MRMSLLKVPLHRRLLGDERGQSIVLGALLLLFVFMATMLTFAIGYRTREKIKLQALADSAAYSLAVDAARTYNFFAWTNRAHVAHDVAILSIHAHASYITYVEGAYKAVANQLNWCAGQFIIFEAACPFTGLCCEGIYDAKVTRDAAKVYWGDDDSPLKGKWLHKQWHDEGTFDHNIFTNLNKLHYWTIKALQLEQTGMQGKMELVILNQKLAGKIADKVDDKIETKGAIGLGPQILNTKNLHGAITYGPGDDWKEFTSATRDTDFLYNRGFSLLTAMYDGVWIEALAKMNGQCAFILPVQIGYGGNAKTTKDAGSAGELKSNIHQHGDDEDGWGRSRAYGAEDHGSVYIPVGVGCIDPCGAIATPRSISVGVISGPQETSSGKHFYYDGSESDAVDHHDMGGCTDTCGIYISHPRYTWGTDSGIEDRLWDYPHTVAFMAKPMTKQTPFDFDIHLGLPFPIHYQTAGNNGDAKSGSKMAAVAGGLVYYHKPKEGNGGDNWKEPPSFWNPFWRAKLHPLRSGDALAAMAGHGASVTAYTSTGLTGINY